MLSEKTVLGTERCSVKNYLSIPNYVDKRCANPEERSAIRLFVEEKEGLTAPQEAYLCYE